MGVKGGLLGGEWRLVLDRCKKGSSSSIFGIRTMQEMEYPPVDGEGEGLEDDSRVGGIWATRFGAWRQGPSLQNTTSLPLHNINIAQEY